MQARLDRYLHNQVVRIIALALAAASFIALQQPAAIARQNATPAAVEEPPPFDQWLHDLIDEAQNRGYSENLIDQTLAGLSRCPGSSRTTAHRRSSSSASIGTTADESRRLVQQGRELARHHGTLLSRLENAYDVQRRFVLAIWGIETRYGRVTGNTPVFQALATLAWEPRRAQFFRGELFNALTMVSSGHIDAASMTGSWAGAMGHPQFMPSSYLKFAEDFDGDGRRDIWRSTPDALASIANYLKESGLERRVHLGTRGPGHARGRASVSHGDEPKRTEGCFAMRNMTERMPLTEWQRLGVRRTNGAALPKSDLKAGLVTPTRAASSSTRTTTPSWIQLRALLRADGRAPRGSNSIRPAGRSEDPGRPEGRPLQVRRRRRM